MKTIYDIMLSLPMFQGIERQKLIQILEKVSIRFEKYQPGDFIVKAGDECKQLVFLLNGSVSLEIVDKSKKFAISEKLSKQMALFPANLFGRQTQYPASVVAIDEVSTMSISKVQTMSLMKSDDVFLLNFLNIVSNRYQQTFDKVSSLADADLRKYFAFFVLSYTERGSTDVVIKSTQQELSDFFGVARPSLLKTVNELRDEGVIEYRRKELSVLNMEKLAEILHS